MTDTLVFEDPPEPSNRQGNSTGVWDRRLAPLREHPGKWARVYGPVAQGTATTFASRLRTGFPSGITAGEFETRYAQQGDGWYVWARYIGDEVTP